MRGGARSPGARWESEPQYPNRSATPHAAHGQPQLPYMNFLGQRPRGHLDSATYRSRRRRGALPRRAAAGGGVSHGGGGYAAGPARARLMETPPLRASRGFGATSARPWLPLAGVAAARRGLRGRDWRRCRHRGPLGPWAGGIGAPPRLLRGRCARRACVGAAGGGATTTGLSARGRGASRRRRASCEGDARGGACVCAAGGNAATAGLSARGRGPIAGAARVAGLAWARLVETPPLRAPRPVGGGRWGAAAPLAGAARAAGLAWARLVERRRRCGPLSASRSL